MSHLKFRLFLFFVLSIFIAESNCQSFTYWGGSTVYNIPFDHSGINGTYHFSYQNLSGLVKPVLVVAVDNVVRGYSLCDAPESGWLPSSEAVSFTEGTHTVKFSLLSADGGDCYHAIIWQQSSFQISCNFAVRVQNNFTKPDGSGGRIYVNDTYGDRPAPYDRYSVPTNYFLIEAIEQPDGYYNRIWNTSGTNNSKWIKQLYNQGSSDYSSDKSTTYTVQSNDKNTTLTAGLRKVYSVPVQNSFVSIGNGGTIMVNGTQYNSPTSAFSVVEQNPITVTAQNQTINGIDYTFTHWSDDANNHQNPRTFYPSDNTTISAIFVGTPNVNSMNVTYNYQSTGSCPTVYWTDNVNTNVSYSIYRSVLNGSSWSSWSLVRPISKGVQHYTDGDYKIAGKSVNYQLKLDACYSTENTTTTAHYCLFAADEWNMQKSNFGNSKSTEITEYKLYNNFPNPFNPSTEIYYQLPNDGNVKLKVYNMMGQEVMTLVNGFKEKGMYSVSFNAGSLASGMYIYKLEAGNYTQVKKMLLTK